MTASASMLISMPEIAELAGVRRPVVTTWRRRHPDFPPQAGATGGRPLFDAKLVVDWLVDTGRAERRKIEPDLRMYVLASLATGGLSRPPSNGREHHPFDPPLSAGDLVAATTSLICLRHLDGDLLHPHPDGRPILDGLRRRAARVDPDDLLLRAEIDALGGAADRLARAADELVEAAWDCRQAYERILSARRRLDLPQLYADAVTPCLAQLVTGLSGAHEQAELTGAAKLAAPYAGAGDLLTAVLDQLPEDVAPTVVAAEPDRFLARVLRRRLAVRDLPLRDVDVRPAASLPAGSADDADTVLIQLPYLPQEQRTTGNPLAGLTDLARTLTPGRTIVLLGPAELLISDLPPYLSAARTRAELLSSGVIEAAIQLPGGVLPYRPGYHSALWVLRVEDASPWRGRVLLADVSDRPLTDRVVDELIWDVTTWRRHGHRPDQHLRAHARQVEIAELVRPRTALTVPRRPPLVDLSGDRRIARVAELEVELARPQREPAPLRTGLAARPEPAKPRAHTVRSLVRSRELLTLAGHRVAAADLSPDGHHPVIGAPELTGAARYGARRIDRRVLAVRYPDARLTEPDDVIVTLVPRPAARHDREGFSLVEFPARVLRIPDAGRHRLTPRVLAALLTEAGSLARAPGAVRPSVRLDQVPLPLPPPDDVHRLDVLLAAVETRADRARTELDRLGELCRIAITGLTLGTLTISEQAMPEPPPGR